MATKLCLMASLVILPIFTTACTGIATNPTATPQLTDANMSNMSGMEASRSTNDFAPLVTGFYEGDEILFIHTEASDPDVANMLTEMMDGPLVVLVPELEEASETLLANVYVFTNGIEGHGPFGFQPDVFDAVPGDEGYRPLRAIKMVEWQEGAEVRELRSVPALETAEAAGEVTITRSGAVVNMPILVWPGGTR